MNEYYTDEEIAELMGITLQRLRNKLHGNQPLPPRIQPPGIRKRLWPVKAVHAWLDNYLVRYEEEAEQRKFGYYK
jgi:hypothetical protein